MGNTKETGQLGEDVACRFLKERGYSNKERNYLKKWGEIDIVVERKGKLHFVEVKAVSRESSDSDGSRETDKYRPEENVHPQKLKRLSRSIQTYLLDRRLDGRDWQFDVVTVKLDTVRKEARVKLISDVIL